MARKRAVARLEGLDDLEAAIKRLAVDTQGEVLREATAAGAEITRSVASQLAPRSADGSHGNPPGFLASHIEAEVKFTRTQDKAEVHVGMHKDAWYGRLQETGTQFASAQPFLRPALDATKDDVVDEIRDQLRSRILRSL
jgi:HK97 gp10 family phage protein